MYQPMDQGIIKTAKDRYLYELLNRKFRSLRIMKMKKQCGASLRVHRRGISGVNYEHAANVADEIMIMNDALKTVSL